MIPELTDEKLDAFADIVIAKGLAPWLHVTTKEQQAQALAEAAATDSFNFGAGSTPAEGIAASARLVSRIAAKLGIADMEVAAPAGK